MSLADWVPPAGPTVLRRNGYALRRDLEDRGTLDVLRALEGFQLEFLAATRALWTDDFPIPPDALAHFSRRWEYPYAWTNLEGVAGRVLDAGSGLTFFPFLLASAGLEVACCDDDASLDLARRYAEAAASTGCRVGYTDVSLVDLPAAGERFDAAVCVSVVEHAQGVHTELVDALAAVLRPGGRLVLTLDVDLAREGDLALEDVAVVLATLAGAFELAHPLDLVRPADLLTSDSSLGAEAWRLPAAWRSGGTERFRSVAVLGVTAIRR